MGYSMDEPISAESAGMPTYVLSISDYGVDTYGLTIVSNSKPVYVLSKSHFRCGVGSVRLLSEGKR
jgi:hypothetical protein